MKNLCDRIKEFKERKILVIGDLMLDKITYGEVNRISPEAPVQVVKVEEEIYQLGGAANVASNIKTLGGNVSIFGFAGNDYCGKIMQKLFREKNIEYCIEDSRQTTLKNRVISKIQHQQLLRVDYEDTSKKMFSRKTKEIMEIEINNSDLILISDYSKGAITKDLMNFLKNTGTKIIVDPKPENKTLYKDVFLITPNEKEALLMSSKKDVQSAGRYLRKKLSQNVLITLGEKGMMLFSDKELKIPTYAKDIFDVVGAGDTVIATLSLSIASGFSLEEAAILANHAASITIEKLGAYSVKFGELEKKIYGEQNKIKTFEELKSLIYDLKKRNQKIVWTNGCFDILHEGHVNYLRKAKELGDYLVVGLNSDESVRKLKGKDRPIRPHEARAEILSSLESVDFVMIFPETSVERYLKELKPQIYVKAGDYNLTNMNQKERKAVEDYNGEIIFIPIEKRVSTTQIIEKIKNNKN